MVTGGTLVPTLCCGHPPSEVACPPSEVGQADPAPAVGVGQELLQEVVLLVFVEVLDGLHDLILHGKDVIGRGQVGEEAGLQEEVEGVADTIVFCLSGKKLYAAVVV